ncbi:pyridine nucleotide-disulfide oxidoreductase [bacterium]|nr:MAG: pyridine nucleotide-disulfide oxidoreductase [bacterium]RKZ15149.1 MAG: pyridine nucleotide-disulfide oxidoreductase [bacterium]
MPATAKTLDNTTDILIIGGGPAGIQAARMLKLERPELDVTVLRPEPHSMVYCAIPYALEGLCSAESTFKKDDLLTEVGVRLVRLKASRVNVGEHSVDLEDGTTLGYAKLFICVGATPVRLPVPGANLENVYTVKTGEDMHRILDRLGGEGDSCVDESAGTVPEGLKAVVIGAGAIGLEQATAYRARGAEVHLVEMQDHPLPMMLDGKRCTEMITQEIDAAGIHFHAGTSVEELIGDGECEAAVLSDGTRIDLAPGRDFVVMATGMRPDIGFLDLEDFEHRPDGLVVDSHMRTSAPDVWAAGDCTSFHSGVDGKPIGGKLATNAVPMAKVAAKDMMGIEAEYPGFYNGAATVMGELRIGGTGFTESFASARGLKAFSTVAELPTRFPMMPGKGSIRVRLVFEEESLRLLGAQMVGTEAVAERIDLLTLAIQNSMTASDLAQLSYSAQPWQTFFPAKNVIVEAATAALDRQRDS